MIAIPKTCFTCQVDAVVVSVIVSFGIPSSLSIVLARRRFASSDVGAPSRLLLPLLAIRMQPKIKVEEITGQHSTSLRNVMTVTGGPETHLRLAALP